jgi:hypothetical protein
VPADRGSGRRRRGRQLASSPRAGSEQLHDLAARGVGQCLEEGSDFGVEIYRHLGNS